MSSDKMEDTLSEEAAQSSKSLLRQRLLESLFNKPNVDSPLLLTSAALQEELKEDNFLEDEDLRHDSPEIAYDQGYMDDL